MLTDSASEDTRASDSACVNAVGRNGCNLYLYDRDLPAGNNLIDVSAGDSSGLGPEVQGVMAVSADGARVYFVARGVLIAGPNASDVEPSEGANNLYVYERNASHPAGRTAFVASLPGDDKSTVRDERPESSEWIQRLGMPANVTPDGSVLVFTSHGALTPDATAGEGAAQVYRYDANKEELLRISIGERGFNNNGNTNGGEARLALSEGTVGSPRRSPTMSDDGSDVFFQSPVGLTPDALDAVPLRSGAVKSQDRAQNIYEWEREGKGGCTQASGCVRLISDGLDASEGNNGGSHTTSSAVELIGSDATGENVFFTTVDPLVKQDTDTQLDIYDARVGGGFPAPAASHFCVEGQTGNECRFQPGSPPAFAPLGSTTFSGAGNLLSPLGGPLPKPKPKPLTRAQLLAKALKLCHAKHKKPKRRACERQARKKYGPKHKAKRKSHGGAKGKRK
jgi:hypothetical protein